MKLSEKPLLRYYDCEGKLTDKGLMKDWRWYQKAVR